MTKNHFFLDTNFLLDYPDFPQEYLFDTQPYTIVVCKVVLNELDRIKKEARVDKLDIMGSNDKQQSERGYKARQALRSIEAVQTGGISLPNGGELLIYKKHGRHGTNADEEIAFQATDYALGQIGNPVILLTSDVNFRIQARNDHLTIENPQKWLANKTEGEYERRKYERRVLQASQRDGQVKLAYDARLQLQRDLEILVNNNGQQSQIEKLQELLKEAKEAELCELERYELEENRRQEENQKRREEELKRRKEELKLQEEELKRQKKESIRQREERRNQYEVTLADISSKSGKRNLAIESLTFEQVGGIDVYRYLWYPPYGYNLICTVHLEVNVGTKKSSILILSASDYLPYTPSEKYQLISPSRLQAPNIILVGNWKIDIKIQRWQINPRPMINKYTGQIGQVPIFTDLAFPIKAVELSDEEANDIRQRLAEEELERKRKFDEEQRLKQAQKAKEARRTWIIVSLVTLLLVCSCATCYTLPILINYLSYLAH